MSRTALALYGDLLDAGPSLSVVGAENLAQKLLTKQKTPDVTHDKELHGKTPTSAEPSPLLRLTAPLRAINTSPKVDAVDEPRKTKRTLSQEWEGIVDAVEGDVFRGHMRPVAGEKRSLEFTEHGVFDIDSVNVRDRPNVKPGAIFRWQIGVSWEGSNRYDYQHLYLPAQRAMTGVDWENIEKDADRFYELFKT